MRKFCFALAALFLISSSAITIRAEEHPVTVKKNPPKITRHSFDPAHPPSTMPKLTPPESGVCHFDCGIDAQLDSFVDQIDPRTVEIEVDSVDMVLDLAIDVWAMNGAPKKLIAHEEGHRQIAEHYYQNADVIARQLGKAMIGRKARGTGVSKQAATDQAMQKLLTELNLAYMNETRARCSACFKRYDKITNHGLLPITEADAIKEALAAEPPPGTQLLDENPGAGSSTDNRPAVFH